MIASGTTAISVTASHSHTWGKTETTLFTWSESFECSAKPGTKVDCKIYVKKVKNNHTTFLFSLIFSFEKIFLNLK